MSKYRNALVALATLFVAAPLVAQHVDATPPAPVAGVAAMQVAAPVVDRAPTIDNSIVGIRVKTVAAPVDTPAPQASSRSAALMVVGVAALLVGAIVGGDEGSIIMIGGGVMGLVGLWRYVQ